VRNFITWRLKSSEDAVVLFHDTAVEGAAFGVKKFFAEPAARNPSFEFHRGYGLGSAQHRRGRDLQETGVRRMSGRAPARQRPREVPLTVVAIDGGAAHELTRMAVQHTLRVIEPEQVLILTDDPKKIAISDDVDYRQFAGKSVIAYQRALWYEVPQWLRTDHFLLIQWDGHPTNADAWTDEFLAYDYIGAPWPWFGPESRVGNGGFSLRSKRLAKYLAANPDRYPLWCPEDDAICRRYRMALMDEGFRWAPEDLAYRFSVESPGKDLAMKPFGFHSPLNWAWALSREERERRLRAASPYVSGLGAFETIRQWHHGSAR
jgi:hypothetical protein